jgi:hypothetical protein
MLHSQVFYQHQPALSIAMHILLAGSCWYKIRKYACCAKVVGYPMSPHCKRKTSMHAITAAMVGLLIAQAMGL